MYIKKILSFLIVILMIAQPFAVRAIEGQNDCNFRIIENQNSITHDNVFSTNAFGGEDVLDMNVIPDGGFVEEDGNDGAEYFTEYSSNYVRVNSTYRDIVHSGTYSGYATVKGVQSYGSCNLNRYVNPNLLMNRTVTLDYWYNPYANPDFLEGGEIYTYLQFYTGSSYHNIYYYFSRNSALSANSTSNGYYDMRGSLTSWFHFDRNITSDYEEAIGPISPTTVLRYVYFYAVSPSRSSGFTELVIDDVSLTNNTGHEQLQNGDFEFGTNAYWGDYRNGPGEITITQEDFTEGTSALNLTASSYYDDSSSYCRARRNMYYDSYYYYKSFQTLQPGDLTFDFDWKYSDVENGGDIQDSYFRILLLNGTVTFDLYYYLGKHTDTVPNSNSTSATNIYRHYAADGFGTRDTWNHFSLDLYEVSVVEGCQGMPIRRVEFYNSAGYNQNATTQLLVDDFQVVTNPIGDPSFELDFDWHVNDPVIGWASNYNHQYANITSDAHSGNYAANTSSHNAYGNAYVRRVTNIPIANNLYTDFWWKLDHITNTQGDYSMIYLSLNNSYYLYYILGRSGVGTVFSNTSTDCYFYVDNFNSTGTWYNLIRDVAIDSYQAFGRSDWNIDEIRLLSYCANPGGKVITLYDDIYFVRDTTPPEISSVDIQSVPMYYETSEVEIIANDLLHDISEVTLSYQHESIWHQIVATETSENTFTAEIPQFEYGTTIEFYVEAYDSTGLNSTDDNSGSNHSYTVGDDVDPYLSIFGPDENETLVGDIIFYIKSLDEGSNITKLSIEIDDTELYNGSAIEDYTLSTTQYEDGDHSLTFTIEDGAGNTMIVEKDISIDNPEPPKQAMVVLGKLFNWGTLVGAGVIALGFGIFLLVRFIRLKKAA